jgi:dimethylargininase
MLLSDSEQTLPMAALHALCRSVSPAFANCELSFIEREPIDLPTARRQHQAYVDGLRALGAVVVELPADPGFPDSVFVEDTVLMFDELAVLTRPGAPSRRGEVAGIERAVRAYREQVVRIEAPGTLDGGDVLQVGRRVFVGQSQRSNAAGIGQLADLLAPFGYRVTPVPLRGCLHLKSAVTALSDAEVLVNPLWVEADCFSGLRSLHVAPGEPHAANVVRISEQILMPESFPHTRAALESAGYAVHAVDVSELQKAEGAVTCCSVLFTA